MDKVHCKFLKADKTSAYEQVVFSFRGSLADKCSSATQSLATDSVIEARLQAALALSSQREYKFWLNEYVQQLCRNGKFQNLPFSAHHWRNAKWYTGSVEKLKGILEDLSGPVYRSRTEAEKSVLGLSKQSLLEELLAFIAAYPQLQRLYTEYLERLESVRLSVTF